MCFKEIPDLELKCSHMCLMAVIGGCHLIVLICMKPSEISFCEKDLPISSYFFFSLTGINSGIFHKTVFASQMAPYSLFSTL
jgi:hypothetical protein